MVLSLSEPLLNDLSIACIKVCVHSLINSSAGSGCSYNLQEYAQACMHACGKTSNIAKRQHQINLLTSVVTSDSDTH